MDIEQFLDPSDEVYEDRLEDLDDMIIGQFLPEEADDDLDQILEEKEEIKVHEAISALEKLQLFEEQQENGNYAFIQSLLRHKRELLSKQIKFY
ncbi:uncharacterized protein N7483_002832 [Penicillium malachiteum]|uniref:uncharacterized protein n=1 Tax=Penicillium malachiteum TaxID=1324776 RepID=UPI0025480A1F|nr:uncharacterized protein N7483_002832 [Penicillium malachiteum]KAJ5737707.1 hypothetical protein N7483_002832 [Penicillium malachiteum]